MISKNTTKKEEEELQWESSCQERVTEGMAAATRRLQDIQVASVCVRVCVVSKHLSSSASNIVSV